MALVSLISIRVATSACWCLSGIVRLCLAAAGHCPALHALSARVDLNLSNASILVLQDTSYRVTVRPYMCGCATPSVSLPHRPSQRSSLIRVIGRCSESSMFSAN